MTEREALRLALEALGHFEKAGLATLKTIDAITAIKQALAQPEPEPVAWLNDCEEIHFDKEDAFRYSNGFIQPLYTSPPKRKPLTDEQLYKVFPAIATYTEANKTLYRSIARAIEAAHGIKGEA